MAKFNVSALIAQMVKSGKTVGEMAAEAPGVKISYKGTSADGGKVKQTYAVAPPSDPMERAAWLAENPQAVKTVFTTHVNGTIDGKDNLTFVGESGKYDAVRVFVGTTVAYETAKLGLVKNGKPTVKVPTDETPVAEPATA